MQRCLCDSSCRAPASTFLSSGQNLSDHLAESPCRIDLCTEPPSAVGSTLANGRTAVLVTGGASFIPLSPDRSSGRKGSGIPCRGRQGRAASSPTFRATSIPEWSFVKKTSLVGRASAVDGTDVVFIAAILAVEVRRPPSGSVLAESGDGRHVGGGARGGCQQVRLRLVRMRLSQFPQTPLRLYLRKKWSGRLDRTTCTVGPS